MSRWLRGGAMRPIPAWRRRYPNDMAVARQSEPDQSVNAEAAAGQRIVPRRERPEMPWAFGNIDFAVQSLA